MLGMGYSCKSTKSKTNEYVQTRWLSSGNLIVIKDHDREIISSLPVPDNTAASQLLRHCEDFVDYLTRQAESMTPDEMAVIVDLNRYTAPQRQELLRLVNIGKID